jgi:hypothetical protein
MKGRARHSRAPVGLLVAGLTASLVAHAQEIKVTGPLLVHPEPSYEPGYADVVRLDGGGVLPFVAIGPNSEASVFGGGGARISVSRRICSPVWFEEDFFGLLLSDASDESIMMGTSAMLRWHPSHTFGIGAGLSGGYLSASGQGYLVTSPFVGPVLVPASFWLGGAHLELRIPLWLAQTQLDGATAMRPALLAPQATLTFGGRIVPPMYAYDGGRSSY